MKNNSTTGIGFFGLLTIVFIVLKLVGVISWSWLWVLSPIWISVGLGVVFLLVALLLHFIADRLKGGNNDQT